MRAFSQIAYADFTDAYEYLQATKGGNAFTIQELKDTALQLNPDAKVGMLYCVDQSAMENWKIVAVHDTNPQNGFYGCIIDTGDGNATLAFRGSEGFNNPDGLAHDWLGSDIGLLQNIQTRQQAEADRFLAKYQDTINSYNNITLTGHSLGGNLAEYSTLVSHKYGFDEKVGQCVSLDGPGFSDEFLKLHALDIARMHDRMTHYKWSWCGGLLFTVPGSHVYEVTVSNDANHKDKEADIGTPKGLLYKHDTKYLNIDENGNFVRGKRDGFAVFMDHFSNMLELSPFGGGISAFVTLLSWLHGNPNAFENFFRDLGRSLKSTYHEIMKSFGKVFHRNADYFKVNTERLSQDSEEIRGYINQVKQDVEEIFSSVQHLGAMWTGPANRAYSAKFAQEKQMIDDYLAEIEGFVRTLEEESDMYRSCENRNTAMMAAVRV